MEYDVIIVGAGPAGLAAGIRLKQLAQAHQRAVSVCILEKGAQVGAHILSGGILNPNGLRSLLPDTWQQAPLDAPVQKDGFFLLTRRHSIPLVTPTQMKNHGNYLIRLGYLCEFLGKEAETLGCEIYPGFNAASLLFNDQNQIEGVKTGNVGLDQFGDPKPQYQPGMELKGTFTLLAEGCRGQLSEQTIAHYQLRQNASPQTYAIGVKELWLVKSPLHQPGTVFHTIGWPLDRKTYGGSFIYYLNNNLIALGFVVGLDYHNPFLSPFSELQRFKTHPWVKNHLLQGGERVGYGARALNEGGWQAVPKLTFPGGALIGDAAGFLNVPQMKGIDNAIQSGIYAAEACFAALEQAHHPEPLQYTSMIQESPMMQALWKARNIRPGFRWGLIPGLLNAGIETYLTRGYSPWTLPHAVDHLSLSPTASSKPIHYPKPDGILTFDRLSSVYLTNTFHEENQPCHLSLADSQLAIDVNYRKYDSPETRYCPAAVYEIVGKESGTPQLNINAQNCIHCKTCDIKDPKQNIHWIAPEGGGGPNYSGM